MYLSLDSQDVYKTWAFKEKENVSMTYKYYQIICAWLI